MSQSLRRRPRLTLMLAVLGGAFAVGPAPSVRGEAPVTILRLGFAVSEFRGPSSRLASILATSDPLRDEKGLRTEPLVVVWGASGGAVLALAADEIRVVPLRGGAADLARMETPRGAVPGSREQGRGPLTVHFSDPTPDHDHGVFGEPVEGRSLTIVERRPVAPGPDPKPVPLQVTRIEAGPDAVFEDREPRLADLDGRGGDPKIVAVRTRRDAGAALAVIGRQDGRWQILAETPPIGAPRRWLNPAAVADLDGDGRMDIALVRTPHRDGLLQIWAWDRDRLELIAQAPGYANHLFGRTAQDLAAVVRLDGRARPALVIPTLDRRALAVVALEAGTLREIGRFPLPSPVATGLAVLGAGSKPHVLVGLEDGTVADVRP